MAKKKPVSASPTLGEKIAEVAHDVIDAVLHTKDEVSSEGESAPPVQSEEVDPMADHPKFAKFKN